eukprot:sb/3475529/
MRLVDLSPSLPGLYFSLEGVPISYSPPFLTFCVCQTFLCVCTELEPLTRTLYPSISIFSLALFLSIFVAFISLTRLIALCSNIMLNFPALTNSFTNVFPRVSTNTTENPKIGDQRPRISGGRCQN